MGLSHLLESALGLCGAVDVPPSHLPRVGAETERLDADACRRDGQDWVSGWMGRAGPRSNLLINLD